MNSAELVVIGGGPAGTAAAITAARYGARVMLLEAGHFPRHKVCGEFVSAESLELLRRLLEGQERLLKDAVRISRARLFVDDYELPTTVQPPAASIPRLDLDAALWESAKHAGVEPSEQARVLAISGEGPFVVRTSAVQVEASAVVDASGRWSNVHAKPAATDKTSTKWIGLKAHFAEASPPSSVDLYFFSGGYCGVQPVSTARVNACAMVKAEVASTLPEVLELHPALRERSRHWQAVSDPVSVAPLIFGTPQPLCDNVLMVGDAAGFVDPFVGDGISLALRTGALAAECLARFFSGNVSLVEAARQYAAAYQQRFGRIFRASSQLRRMLLWPKVVRSPILAMLQRSPGMTSYLVRNTR